MRPPKAVLQGRRSATLAGSLAVGPILFGVVPFGLATGAATAALGLSSASSIGMSIFMFAGTAQLATVQLLREQAPVFVIIATALVINARFMMYSASLSPHFSPLPLRWKGPLAYLLSDQAFVVSIARFDELGERLRKWFYVGAAVTLWLTWQGSFAVGVLLGARMPTSWSLDFAVPLTLLALIPATIRDTSALVTLGATAVGVVAFHDLPMNLGIIASVSLGVASGWCFQRLRTRRREAHAS